MNEWTNIWINICLCFKEEEDRKKNFVISSSSINDGPTNQPTNRPTDENTKHTKFKHLFGYHDTHCDCMYDKNIAANMNDIDDNDRTMTWTNFLVTTNILTDDEEDNVVVVVDVTTQIAERESIHNEHQASS